MPNKNPSAIDNLTSERGSGNVFADIGLENSGELLRKADLAYAIASETSARGWTEAEAAAGTRIEPVGHLADWAHERRRLLRGTNGARFAQDRGWMPRSGSFTAVRAASEP